MNRRRQQRGERGEQIAVSFLQRLGYQIEHRNYRCRQGEIDIIAKDGSTLVFVEVKTKAQAAFGVPQAMVTPTKQKTITHVAMRYVQQYRFIDMALRFDVIGITFLPNGTAKVEHIPAAFNPPGTFFY